MALKSQEASDTFPIDGGGLSVGGFALGIDCRHTRVNGLVTSRIRVGKNAVYTMSAVRFCRVLAKFPKRLWSMQGNEQSHTCKVVSP